MTAKEKGKKECNPGGFYGRALDESKRLELEEASRVEGIDEEIALLRMKLRELVKEQPDKIDLQLEAANIIGRLVRIQHQMTREQNESLSEAVQKVLTEIAVPLGIGIGIKVASN